METLVLVEVKSHKKEEDWFVDMTAMLLNFQVHIYSQLKKKKKV
jgi:predicted site-specific integrase-resolvase